MVNRVLIRVKVVQMLYSYLLTRSEFKVNEAPLSDSTEKRYEYSIYIDMALLLLKLSGYRVGNRDAAVLVAPMRLADNPVAKALSGNDIVRETMSSDRVESSLAWMQTIAPYLLEKVKSSRVFLDYSKKRDITLGDTVTMWVAVFETIVARDQRLADALRTQGGYSSSAFQQGVEAFCETLRSYADSKEFFDKAKRDLVKSLDKAYVLYLTLFSLILDLTKEQERRLETARAKHLASSDDLNPNTKLLDNKLVKYLEEMQDLADLMKEYKVQRQEETSLFLRSMLDKILESDLYKQYISTDEQTLEGDAEFWRDALRTIVLPSDLLLEEMENMSVYWNDDLQIMGTFALKTLRQISQCGGHKVELLPKFKDHEDERFGPELFDYTVKNYYEYRQYVNKFVKTSRWDPERLAYMDIVILCTAIAEIIHYPAIPVAVSVNEYVEIANNYSTDKSGGFVNGILYNLVKYLNDEGIIHKN